MEQDQLTDLLGVDNNTLFSLLKSGKLAKKDHKEQSILSHLHAIKTGHVKPGVRKIELVNSALAVLSDRNQITQGTHGTCGAASLQQALWKKNPAEMIRIVRNLAQKGLSSLQKGNHTLKADPHAFGFHTQDRNDFNTLFQSAIMTSAALVGGKYASEFLTKGLQNTLMTILSPRYNVRQDAGNFTSVIKGDSAANPYQLKGLLQDITGKSFILDTRINFFNGSAFNTIKQNQAKEPMVLFNAQGGELHYVTIIEVTNSKVRYQDTATSPGQVKTVDVAGFKKNFILSITQEK